MFGLSVISLPALPPVVGFATVVAGLVAAILYIRHAKRTPRPILDLGLFSNRTFRAAILGGSLFRVGIGAVPFLLPLMFQVVFGMTPFESGLLTFASAFGALMMKFVAKSALRAAGFRTVLIIAVLFGAAFIAVNALFTPATPHAVIIGVLVISGLLRSLFFTSTNALVFAEIDDSQASQASTIAAAMQQVSIALGVAVGGGILEATAYFTGTELGMGAFVNAFVIIAFPSALAAIPFFSLPPGAGSVVSGHRSRMRRGDYEAAPAAE